MKKREVGSVVGGSDSPIKERNGSKGFGV